MWLNCNFAGSGLWDFVPCDHQCGHTAFEPSIVEAIDAAGWMGPSGGDSAGNGVGDAVARACTLTYAGLGRGGKPVQGAQQRQWTVLAGAVLVWPGGQPAVVSLATGVKCLPYVFFGSHGDVVHDQHAEVLVRRGLRRWVLRQLLADAGRADPPLPGLPQPVFRPGSDGRWLWNDTYRLSLYVSRVPCGAASAALLPEGEVSTTTGGNLPTSEPGGADPAAAAGAAIDARARSSAMRGRTDLGINQRERVRTKPGRLDAPVATSMSCSDKLALWGVVGVQGSLLSPLLAFPVRYAHIVVGCDGLGLGPSDDDNAKAQMNARMQVLEAHVAHALVGRVQGHTRDTGATAPNPVQVHVTSEPFVHAHDCVDQQAGGPLIACADALSFVPSLGVTKLSPLGTKAGAPAKRTAGAALRPSSYSPLCKAAWFAEFVAVATQLRAYTSADSACPPGTYRDAKRLGGSNLYRIHKAAVRGPDAHGVEALRVFLREHHVGIDAPPALFRSALGSAPHSHDDCDTEAPLAGWLVSDAMCEAFNLS